MNIKVGGDLHIGTLVERGAVVVHGNIENYYAADGTTPTTVLSGEPKYIEAAEVVDTPQLPQMLDNEEGRCVLKTLQDGGLLDDRLQPVGMTRAGMAILAHEASMMLWEDNRWTPWEELWGVRSMSNAFVRAMNQKQMGSIMDKVRKCLKG